MPYKVSGDVSGAVNADWGTVYVLDETDFSIEASTMISDTNYFEITGLTNSPKTILAVMKSGTKIGEAYGVGNITPTFYENITFLDDFTGTNNDDPDPEYWTLYEYEDSAAYIQNNQLFLHTSNNATDWESYVDVEFNNSISGDFTLSFKFILDSVPTSGAAIGSYYFEVYTSVFDYVGFYLDIGSSWEFEIDDNVYTVSALDGVSTVYFKLNRSGTTWTASYSTNNSTWVQVFEYTQGTENITYLGFGSYIYTEEPVENLFIYMDDIKIVDGTII